MIRRTFLKTSALSGIGIFITSGFSSPITFNNKTDNMKNSKKVSIDNYNRAETDRVFQERVDMGMFGKIVHNRDLAPLDKQTVPRLNRDTFYSYGIFDLTNPLIITKPDTGNRFQSILFINEDQYINKVIYEPGTYTITQEEMDTRYIQVAFRTFCDVNSEEDVKEVHNLQDQISINQKAIGSFEVPDWDPESLKKNSEYLKLLGSFLKDSERMFGNISEVEPTRHLIGTAAGWGGNRTEDAIYVNRFPKLSDGKTPHVLHVIDVPVDGFWSVSLYNKDGYFEVNEYNAYSINNITAKKNSDGSVTIHFGGDPKSSNFLPIMEGWNYTARLYIPRKEILDGDWIFPMEQIVK